MLKRVLFIQLAICILTLIVLFAGTELISRHYFFRVVADSCQVTGRDSEFAFRPNCISHTNTYESPVVTNQYNDCGFRTNESCGPKQRGVFRIALIGSSVAQGWNVSYNEAFAERTAAGLTYRCRRKVEVQNLGRPECSVLCMSHHIDEALALKPDLLIVAISPYDVETLQSGHAISVNNSIAAVPPDTSETPKQPFIKRVEALLPESRTKIAVEHFIFQNPATYLHFYLSYGDKADYLRTPFTPAWEGRLQTTEFLIQGMAEKARAANVKLVILAVPSLAQAAVVNLPKPLPNVDAYALDERIKSVSARDGVAFIDVLNNFRDTPHSNRHFYMTAPHLDGIGHSLVSAPLLEQLTDGQDPLIAGCTAPPTPSTESN